MVKLHTLRPMSALLLLLACSPRETHTIAAKNTAADMHPDGVVQPGVDPDWGELRFRITNVQESDSITIISNSQPGTERTSSSNQETVGTRCRERATEPTSTGA
jgi:hypothetical protein